MVEGKYSRQEEMAYQLSYLQYGIRYHLFSPIYSSIRQIIICQGHCKRSGFTLQQATLEADPQGIFTWRRTRNQLSMVNKAQEVHE